MNKDELTTDQLCIDATMRLYNKIRSLFSKQMNTKKINNAARIYTILIALKMAENDFSDFIQELSVISDENFNEIKQDAHEKAVILMNILIKKV